MDTLARLEATIRQRRSASPHESYVARLEAEGVKAIARKLGEEAGEAVIAALAGEEEELIGESADVRVRLLVLLAHKDIPLAAVLGELERREGTSGLAEKAARGS